jgi:hypothetical protein
MPRALPCPQQPRFNWKIRVRRIQDVTCLVFHSRLEKPCHPFAPPPPFRCSSSCPNPQTLHPAHKLDFSIPYSSHKKKQWLFPKTLLIDWSSWHRRIMFPVRYELNFCYVTCIKRNSVFKGSVYFLCTVFGCTRLLTLWGRTFDYYMYHVVL